MSSPPTAAPRYAVALNSGTSALHLALLAAGIGPGDEVITTPMTFVATVAAILYAGATPVFVDIDPRTWTIDPAQARARDHAADQGDRAGAPARAPWPTWTRSSRSPTRTGLSVIEDAAQAHGAEYKGRRAGSIGDLGCFSFYPGKNLGACGEGGAVVTDDAELRRDACACCGTGARRASTTTSLKGFNYRMDGLQGAVLRVKLRHLEAWTEARRRARRALRRAARRSRHRQARAAVAGPAARLPRLRGPRAATATRCAARCAQAGIATGIHYPIAGAPAAGLCRPRPRAGRLSHRRAPRAPRPCRCRSIPELTDEQIERVCAALRSTVPDDCARLRGRPAERLVAGGAWPASPPGPIRRYEIGLAADLQRTVPAAMSWCELYRRFAGGDGYVDALLRRACLRALARRFGHGVTIGPNVGIRHPETFEIGDGVFLGEQAMLQGRFDGRCVIGDRRLDRAAELLRRARPRDRRARRLGAGGEGARLGRTPASRPTCRSSHTDLMIAPVRIGDLGGHRRQRDDPAGRHARARLHRRRRRRRHPRRARLSPRSPACRRASSAGGSCGSPLLAEQAGRVDDDLTGKRVLVTGGAGFVGSHIVDLLLDGAAAPRSSSSTTWCAAGPSNLARGAAQRPGRARRGRHPRHAR